MIRLVVVDVDGCLTRGEAQPWDFEVLRLVADLNQKARLDSRQFAVTVVTGRQEPYVEAMMQAIAGCFPAVYENGGGLYFPSPYRFVQHPAFTPARRATYEEIRRVLRETIIADGIAQFQPGKEVTLTLYPAREGITFEQIAEAARRALGETLRGFSIHAAVSSVEILPIGIDKGAGVEWLSEVIGIPLEQMGGIGDAPGDLRFLTRVGFSAAPANASDDVKCAVQYVSPFENGRGVVDILSHWMNHERR
ncbi:MAG TPA: HAD hydrolase family protein [Anaerolineae bacterium]|nr:HAD hydrolase family protein [Anaerolineae bacterium]